MTFVQQLIQHFSANSKPLSFFSELKNDSVTVLLQRLPGEFMLDAGLFSQQKLGQMHYLYGCVGLPDKSQSII